MTTTSVTIQGFKKEDCYEKGLKDQYTIESGQECEEGCPAFNLLTQNQFAKEFKSFDIEINSIVSNATLEAGIKSVSLIEESRNGGYQRSITFSKYMFTFTTVIVSLLILNKLSKHRLNKMGIVQKKVVILLILLFLFNEPLLIFGFLSNLRIYAIVQAIVQASFFGFLLHFWAYLLDTIVQNN